MEKSANTIGERKFSRMGAVRQHRLLAELAAAALDGEGAADFPERYDRLQSWTNLDRYRPPRWLSRREALEGFRAFHSALAGTPYEKAVPARSQPVAWNPGFPITVALDRVRSPYNFGSVLRLVDNFGFEAVVHDATWLREDHPQLKRAARGCETWIPFRLEPDLLAWLSRCGRTAVALENDDDALPLQDWRPPERFVLLVGNEEHGLAAALKAECSQKVRIPLFGYKASMNLGHALAVVGQRIVDFLGEE